MTQQRNRFQSNIAIFQTENLPGDILHVSFVPQYSSATGADGRKENGYILHYCAKLFVFCSNVSLALLLMLIGVYLWKT